MGTAAGRRANLAAALLTALISLAEAWALVSLARGLTALARASGLLLPGDRPASGAAVIAVTGQADLGAGWQPHLLSACVAALVSAAAATAVQLVARRSAATEEGELRRLALAHLFDLGPAHAGSARSGATVSLLTDGAERVALYRQTFLAPTIAAVASPLLVLVLVGLTVDWLPAAVLAAAFILVPGFIAGFHRRYRGSSSGSRAQRSRLSAEYLDAIQGLTALVLARAAGRRSRELRAAGEANRRAVMGLLAGNQMVILITDALFSLFLVTASAGLALARLGSGRIGLADALALVLVALVLLEPLDHVGAFFYVGMGGLANQRAMHRLLARQRPRGAEPTASQDDEETTGSFISLRGVTAAWDGPDDDAAGPSADGAPTASPGARGAARAGGAAGAGRAGGGGAEASGAPTPAGPSPVLSGIDLEVAAGERLAIVGPSGAGKSTLMALLSGDLLPTAGTVRVAGTASGAETQDQVRAASAVVAQTTWLFTGTIVDNLALADPTATEARMWQALEAANLAPEVRAMPEGIHTAVGERGLGLSGGQAQRVALARAFLADRPLLLLDEPTSQVDLAGEAQIIEAIDRLSAGRTVVTVSHRAGALSTADRVVAVESGGLR